MDAVLRVSAPAKVNLHLDVGAVRPDGYHDVVTVLQALTFGDTVTIVPSSGFTFSCTPDLGLQAEQNLAHRAAHAMAAWYERPLDVSVDIEKRIPAGAGLGGASADAAAVLAGLAMLWGVDLADPGLTAVARSLGADVPFFLTGGAALFTGRGDVLARRLTSLTAHIVLARPDAPVPTADAYRAFDALPRRGAVSADRVIDALEAGDVRTAADALHNNMAAAAISLVPEIEVALGALRSEPGVLGAIVAGSGSSVFGVCDGALAAERAARAARAAGLWAVATVTSAEGCAIERL